jgi:hypothetical protein
MRGRSGLSGGAAACCANDGEPSDAPPTITMLVTKTKVFMGILLAGDIGLKIVVACQQHASDSFACLRTISRLP